MTLRKNRAPRYPVTEKENALTTPASKNPRKSASNKQRKYVNKRKASDQGVAEKKTAKKRKSRTIELAYDGEEEPSKKRNVLPKGKRMLCISTMGS